MISPKTQQYLKKIRETADHNKRMAMMVEGIQYFFDFSRIMLFSLSPISSFTEILIAKEKNEFPNYYLREHLINFPNVREAASKKQTVFVKDAKKDNVPIKYVNDFNLSHFWITPICYMNSVHGFLLLDQYKGSNPHNQQLFQSIETYLSFSGQLISPFFKNNENITLSKREIEILNHVASGYSNKEIADYLSISEYTVRDYIVSATKRLNSTNRTQAVVRAIQLGYIK